MSEMVDRVAKAICESQGLSWEYDRTAHNLAQVHARAAIAAMREPTPDMLALNPKDYPNFVAFWRAVIDAGLE